MSAHLPVRTPAVRIDRPTGYRLLVEVAPEPMTITPHPLPRPWPLLRLSIVVIEEIKRA